MTPRKNRKRRERKKRANARNRNDNPRTESPEVNYSSSSSDETLFFSFFKQFERLTIDPSLENFVVNNNELIDEFIILGNGAFGRVTRGTLRKDGRAQKVAIKTSHKKKHDAMLINEAKVMSKLDHPQIIKLLAVQKQPLKIAIEFMDLGNILNALEKIPFSDNELIKAVHDVALGMEFMASKNFIHMDLACRNVFVNSDKQIKIGDFGLSKYVGNTGGMCFLMGMHNALCAPETAHLGIFTTKSDVWSMGLLIWDLYWVASKLPAIWKQCNLELFQTLVGCADVLPRPPLCPKGLHTYTTTALLNVAPSKRPHFKDVVKTIESFVVKPSVSVCEPE